MDNGPSTSTMNTNQLLIHHFYTCFSQRDYYGMQECYSPDARFSDPVFRDLDSRQTKAMWEMLCKRGRDLQIEFSDIKGNGENGSVNWEARYSFSQTGRKVVNRVHAEFQFRNGLFIRHEDHFNFYKWSRQALGLPGLLLGWTPGFQKKVQEKASEGLQKFIEQSH